MTKTHTNAISKIPNAINGRESADLNIFGMNGVPKHIIEERVLVGAAQYWSKVMDDNEKDNKKRNPHLYEHKKEKEGMNNIKVPSTIRNFVNLEQRD
jgi:hypothetical protein